MIPTPTALVPSAAVHAQTPSASCCVVTAGGLNDSKTTMNVTGAPPNKNGSYISSETQNFPMSCISSVNQKSCQTPNPPNNVVTATGGYGWFADGSFVACNPGWVTSTTATLDPSTGISIWANKGISYSGLKGGTCYSPSSQEMTTSCNYVECPTVVGGGGCNPDCPLPQQPPESRMFHHPPKFLTVQATECCSPVLIDTTGLGFSLTSPQTGVLFDITGSGVKLRIAWTAKDSGDAFLALPASDGLVAQRQTIVRQ